MAQDLILERLPDGFSKILPAWKDQTIVIFGGGPSLTPDQVKRVRIHHEAGRLKAIGVNDAFLWAPWVDLIYGADSRWWLWTKAGTAKPKLELTAEDVANRYKFFAGQKLSIQNSGSNITDPDVHKLRNMHFPHNTGVGISLDPTKLVTARGSGYQAVNVAILALGCQGGRIILLGFDGKRGADGRSHWFGDHPVTETDAVYEQFRKGFSAGETAILDTGVEVLNCSPGSAYDNFPKMELSAALARII